MCSEYTGESIKDGVLKERCEGWASCTADEKRKFNLEGYMPCVTFVVSEALDHRGLDDWTRVRGTA